PRFATKILFPGLAVFGIGKFLSNFIVRFCHVPIIAFGLRIYATSTHLRSRARRYIASITLTRAAASRGLTSGWSFAPDTASRNCVNGGCAAVDAISGCGVGGEGPAAGQAAGGGGAGQGDGGDVSAGARA